MTLTALSGRRWGLHPASVGTSSRTFNRWGSSKVRAQIAIYVSSLKVSPARNILYSSSLSPFTPEQYVENSLAIQLVFVLHFNLSHSTHLAGI